MKGRLQKKLIFRAFKINTNAKEHELLSYKLVIARIRAKSIARIDSIGMVERHSNLSFIKIDFNKMINYIKKKKIKMSFSMFKFFSKKTESKPLDETTHVFVRTPIFTPGVKIKLPQKRIKRVNNENNKLGTIKQPNIKIKIKHK